MPEGDITTEHETEPLTPLALYPAPCDNHNGNNGNGQHPPQTPEPPFITERISNTDMGNGTRMAVLFRSQIRYSYPEDLWYVWNGRIWERNAGAEIDRMAKTTVRSIYEEGLDADDDDTRIRLLKHALASEAKGRVSAMIDMCKSELGIPVSPDRFDSDKYLLCVQNGTIDLHTSQLRPHCQDDFITKISPVSYDPNALCPTWLTFLNTVFDGDQDLILYMQKLAGYSMTGETKEEEFDILYGTGGNGKSKFVDQIAYILGDYWVKANVETILASEQTISGGAASGDVAALKGARLVTVSEPDKGKELREGRIKDFTGRDPITARRLYQEPFTFIPEFKLLLITNHKPRIKSTDRGIWRRVRLIPFEVTIPDEQIDKDLATKLRAESSGILNWMIQGCLLWQRDGLNPPQNVKAATDEYREEMDWLAELFNKFCEKDKSATILNKRLYLVYSAWCSLNGSQPMSHITFPQAIQERGFKKRRTENGNEYVGLKLKPTVLKTCEQIESGWGGDVDVGLQVMKVFLQTFTNITPRGDFTKKPTEPTEPTGNTAPNNEIQNFIKPTGMQVNPTGNNINNNDKSTTPQSNKLINDLHLHQQNFEKVNGVINTSNITNFVMGFCEQYKPKWQDVDGSLKDYNPSAIKGIASKLFKLTPGGAS